MSALAAVRRGLPALLSVHALRTLWALLVIGPLYRELAHALERSVFSAAASAGDAALALEVIGRSAPRMLPAAGAWLVSYALLAPAFQQAVLLGLSGARLAAACSHALQRYPAALFLRAVTAMFGLVGAGVVALALHTTLAWLPPSPGLELSARLICAGALASGGLWLATAHDLAVARVALGAGPLVAGGVAVWQCRSAAVCRNALALAAAGALLLLAERSGRCALALPYAAGPIVVLAAQQALLFAALLARALWQAHTLALSPPRP